MSDSDVFFKDYKTEITRREFFEYCDSHWIILPSLRKKIKEQLGHLAEADNLIFIDYEDVWFDSFTNSVYARAIVREQTYIDKLEYFLAR